MSDREMLSIEHDFIVAGETVDFSWIPDVVATDGDTITTAAADVAGATESSTTFDATSVTTMLTNVDDAAAVVVVVWTITTAAGRTWVRELRLEVRT